ncbi:MAG: hypothetical protein OXJ52_05165 [Oligoflexia bacterium]|nr:hypothetical protein [Oligoflexia bacterium]
MIEKPLWFLSGLSLLWFCVGRRLLCFFTRGLRLIKKGGRFLAEFFKKVWGGGLGFFLRLR